jgi:cytochrome c biogenesis factor
LRGFWLPAAFRPAPWSWSLNHWSFLDRAVGVTRSAVLSCSHLFVLFVVLIVVIVVIFLVFLLLLRQLFVLRICGLRFAGWSRRWGRRLA